MRDIVIQERYREAAELLAAVAEPADPTTAVVEGEAPAASTAMEFPPARGWLQLVCYKCTRVGQFIAATQQEAQQQANHAGWKMNKSGAVCKRCPC